MYSYEAYASYEASSRLDTRGGGEGRDNLLLNFIKNKIWGEAADNDKKGHNSEESLNKVESTDAFEEKYNFRFEDKAAS